jgi:hypothetical protein
MSRWAWISAANTGEVSSKKMTAVFISTGAFRNDAKVKKGCFQGERVRAILKSESEFRDGPVQTIRDCLLQTVAASRKIAAAEIGR